MNLPPISKHPAPADVAHSLLRKAITSGAEWANVFVEQSTTRQYSLKQKASRRSTTVPTRRRAGHELAGASLCAYRKDQLFFDAAPGLPEPALQRLDNRIAELRWTDNPPGPGHAPDTTDAAYDPAVDALLQSAADAALSLDDRVSSVAVQYVDRRRCTEVFTSENPSSPATTSHASLRIEVELEYPAGRVRAYAIDGSAGSAADLAGEALAREAVLRARIVSEARSLPPGIMPVVIAAGWGGVWLHEAVGHLLEADVASSAFPDLASRLNQPFASECVTLIDDPTLPDGRGSYTVDDEGTPAKRTTLIEHGILRSVLTGYRESRRLALPRSGNARRQDYRFAPHASHVQPDPATRRRRSRRLDLGSWRRPVR